MKNHIIIGILSIILVGCFPIETDNPTKAWKYWAGSEPPDEIQLIKGEYYQSPHFSLEYELFLNFKTEKKWFDDFVAYNNLELDTIRNDWIRWTDLPDWFKLNNEYLIYCKDQVDEFERSRYIFNPSSGNCYIYETVGM